MARAVNGGQNVCESALGDALAASCKVRREDFKRVERHRALAEGVGMDAGRKDSVGLTDGFFTPRCQRLVGDEDDGVVVGFKIVQRRCCWSRRPVGRC